MSEYINGTTDILGGSVIRYALNTTTPNQAVIRKIIAGNGISISSTGVDPGTGDVTISIDTSGTGGSGSGGNGGGSGTPTAVGTVTSVNMIAPEGMFITGAPITTAGTIALRLSSGYVVPLYVDVEQGKTAYSWGNHALAGYLLTESDTLDSVTDRGNITTNKIEIGGIYANADRTTNLVSEINYFVHRRLLSSGVMGFKLHNGSADTSFWRWNDGTGDVEFGNATNYGLQFYVNDTVVGKFFNTGNLVIGTSPTDTGSYKFDVRGSVILGNSRLNVHNVYGALTVGNGSTGTDLSALTVRAMGTGGSQHFRVRTINNDGDIFAVQENGYILAGGTFLPTNGRSGFIFDAFGVSPIGFNLITRSNNTGGIFRGIFVTEGNLNGITGGNFDSRYVEVSPTINATIGSEYTVRGFYYNPNITNLAATILTHYAWENTAGGIKMGNLAGTGTRWVVADANGVLSTQTITSTGSSVTINNNADYRVITGSNTADTLNGSTKLLWYNEFGILALNATASWGYGAEIDFVNTDVNGTVWGFYGGSTAVTGLMLYQYQPTQVELAYWNTDRYAVRSDVKMAWSSTLLSWDAPDIALARESTGLLQINTGTSNTYAEVKAKLYRATQGFYAYRTGGNQAFIGLDTSGSGGKEWYMGSVASNGVDPGSLMWNNETDQLSPMSLNSTTLKLKVDTGIAWTTTSTTDSVTYTVGLEVTAANTLKLHNGSTGFGYLYLNNLQALALAGTGTRMVVSDSAGVLSTQTIPSGGVTTGVTSGGIVTWSGTGFVYDVSYCVYYINGVQYTTAATQVTLGAADVSNPRLDVIAVTTSGTVVVVPGTPAANPVTPQVDATTQLELTTILVPANASSPTGITTSIVYDEVVNANYTKLATGVTVNFASTTTPYVGAVAAAVSASTTGTRTIEFTRGTTDTITNYSVIKFAMRLSTAWVATSTIAVSFFNNTTQVSTEIAISNGLYGFAMGTINTYQLLQLNIRDFRFTSSTFNKVRFRLVNSAPAFILDRVELQGGVVQTNIQSNNIYTTDGSLASIRTLTLNGNSLTFQGSTASTIFAATGAVSFGGAVTLAQLAGTGDRIVAVNSTGVSSAVSIGSGLSLSGGILTATGGAAGTVTATPGGTSGYLAKFSSASNIVDSIISESGSVISIAGSLSLTSSVTATSFVKSGGTSAQYLMADGSVTTSTFLTSGSFVSDYDSAVTGLRNSSNKVYTLTNNYQTGTTKVYVNGVRYSPGSGNDYTESASNQITFTNAPDSGDLILVDYIKS